jgi:hypothetical protein
MTKAESVRRKNDKEMGGLEGRKRVGFDLRCPVESSAEMGNGGPTYRLGAHGR